MSTTNADPDLVDHTVYLHDVSWHDYQRLLRMRGETAVPSITWLEGEVELLSPSQRHEWINKTIARLIETWSEERGIGLTAFGHWTQKSRRLERGLDPDGCYVIGEATKTRPDLAIEVVWTSGGIDKLDAYLGFGVPEVWVWEDAHISVHVLQDDLYVEHLHSMLLPDLDLPELASFVEHPSQPQTVREYRALLRSRFANG